VRGTGHSVTFLVQGARHAFKPRRSPDARLIGSLCSPGANILSLGLEPCRSAAVIKGGSRVLT
jgi:hypothetical protein